ncbi:hypothetical protein DOY81_009829 [Sarcophaga bullata]|nr:hypothetical protein DOY81_009829 [Sarcophaga bullata]
MLLLQLQQHHKQQHQHASSLPEQLENNKNAQQSRFNSTYLPEIINPLEWQKSRKRKERLDSTSSTTQDRKLQRSNSEELLPQDNGKLQDNNNVASTPSDLGNNAALKTVKNADNIRRVSSEDFKRTPYEVYEQELKENTETISSHTKASDENDASLANRQSQRCQAWTVGVPIKDMTRRSRYETSPARSQRHSPIRVCFSGGNGNGNGKHRDNSDDSECEHERRRSSERFCKSRAPPGRKASGITKKSSNNTNAIRYLPSKLNDENVYKYDLSALKHERRGFISKKSSNSASSNAASLGGLVNVSEKTNNTNDLNDNNLIDFNNAAAAAVTKPLPLKTISPTASSHGSNDDVHNNGQQQQQQQQQQANDAENLSQQ